MLTNVEAFRSNSQSQQGEARPSGAAAPGVSNYDFGGDLGMSAPAAKPAVSRSGTAAPLGGPSHDPFNMLAAPAPARKPMQPDTGFADFVGAAPGSKPTHTGHDSLI